MSSYTQLVGVLFGREATKCIQEHNLSEMEFIGDDDAVLKAVRDAAEHAKDLAMGYQGKEGTEGMTFIDLSAFAVRDFFKGVLNVIRCRELAARHTDTIACDDSLSDLHYDYDTGQLIFEDSIVPKAEQSDDSAEA